MSRRDQKRHTLVRKLAPGISPAWAEEFVLELRLRGVSGEDVGSALAEVESHCAESGEPVEEAFGPAADYARSLELPVSAQHSTHGLLRVVGPQAIQVIGLFALISAAVPLSDGDPMGVTLGIGLNAAIVVLLILLLAWKAGAAVRNVARKPVVGVAVGIGFFAVMVASAVGLQQEILSVSPWWGLVLGVGCQVLGTVLSVLRVRGSRESEDVLTVPFEDEQEPGERRRQMRRAELAPAVLIPAFAVVMFLVLFLLG